MVLGIIMEIAFLLLGIFSLINDPMFGIALIVIVIILWIAGLIWEEVPGVKNEKCRCEELEYTNQYADSWKCKKCNKVYPRRAHGKSNNLS